MYTDLQQMSFAESGTGPALSDAQAATSRRPQGMPPRARPADRKQYLPVVPKRADGLLSHNEELSLFHRWKESHDDSALHALVLAHEPLIASIVGGRRGSGNMLQDVKQEARCGLLEAARHFDPDKGFRFGTYARWWVLSAVSTYMVANRDVLSSERMKRKPKASPSYVVSIDAPITPEGDSLAELIPSEAAGPDLIVEQSIDGERMNHRLAMAIHALDPREREILQRRHLSEEPDTLQMLAQDMRISAERVRQIEKTALARLRELLDRSKGGRNSRSA
jgi:RNA polymerase sigma-32 factor